MLRVRDITVSGDIALSNATLRDDANSYLLGVTGSILVGSDGSNGPGNDITVLGGVGDTGEDGGNINLVPGVAGAGGSDGEIRIIDSSGSNDIHLSVSSDGVLDLNDELGGGGDGTLRVGTIATNTIAFSSYPNLSQEDETS
jgi:hypothetical protein